MIVLNDHRILWKEKVELCHVFALAWFFAVLRDDRSIRHEENEGAMQFPLYLQLNKKGPKEVTFVQTLNSLL